jgi:biofilm PGA synthesis N-glycosyltransferase PgaC
MERILAAILFWCAVSFILYTYVGYPIIITLLSRLVTVPQYSLRELPSVSLLIPAYNEEDVIGRKIQNSLNLDYPKDKLQILVAADGSNDRTPDLVRSYEKDGIELNYLPNRSGKMAAINRAVPECAGEIIVFSDANNFYTSDAIFHLIRPFADPKVGATSGSKRIIEDERDLSSAEGLYWKYESIIKKKETLLGSTIAAVGEILAIRKNLFISAPTNIINDDRYLVLSMLKRGYNVVYVPEAESYEYVSKSAKDEIIRRKRINAGGFQAIFLSKKLLPFNRPFEVWKIISHKYFRAFVPFAFILAFISNLILVIFPVNYPKFSFFQLSNPYNWIFLGIQIIFYLVGIIGNMVKFPGMVGKILYLPTFLLNSNYAIIIGLLSYFSDHEAHLWERVNRADLP